MSLINNLQSFSAGASGTAIQNLTPVFKTAMDSILLGMGRNISLHLQPTKTKCPSTNCRFNDTYKKFIGQNGTICRVCGGEGFKLEPRQTVYLANIRWVDETLASPEVGGKATPAGRMYNGDVRTKTVIESYNDIQNCIAAEIDGRPVKLKTSPRVTGFGGNLYYVVAFWEEVDKKINR